MEKNDDNNNNNIFEVDSKYSELNFENQIISSNFNNGIQKEESKNNIDSCHDIPNQTSWEILSPCIFYPFCCFKRYNEKCSCCNELISPCVTIEGKYGKRTFWGFLELDLFGPLFSLILIFLSHFVFSFTVLKFIKKDESLTFFYFVLFLTIFLLVMFLWSFLYSACSDPGFLPFDWKTLKQENEFGSVFLVQKVGWRRQLSGLAINDDQIEYAKKNCPPFATFSRSAGRFVVRADHICGWTGNWIGKRNHKQFILMTFWGSLMMINLFFFQFKYAKMKTKNIDGKKSFKYLFSMGIVGFFLQFFAVLLEPIFIILFLGEFCQSIRNIFKNTTKIKNMKKTSQKINGSNEIIRYNIKKSFREICGNSSIFCMIFPFAAFDDELTIIDDEFLLDTPQVLY